MADRRLPGRSSIGGWKARPPVEGRIALKFAAPSAGTKNGSDNSVELRFEAAESSRALWQKIPAHTMTAIRGTIAKADTTTVIGSGSVINFDASGRPIIDPKDVHYGVTFTISDCIPGTAKPTG